jgi:3-oxoacyl-[acyl-carrier protein] reductase
MMRFDLTGKAALVTGAASGIGLATATMLARFGCTVAMNHLPDDPRGPEAVARLAGERLHVIAAPGNVGVAGDAERMVLAAVEKLGRLDLLVNNAGTPGVRAAVPPDDFAAMTEAMWETILQTNLLGVFRCSKAAVPALRSARGAIVSVASIAGVSAQGSSAPYGASKAGVVNLTRSLARGLGPEVRVNAVAPGSVDNDAWPIAWSDAYRREAADKAVLKRRCATEDIAEVIVFLGFGAAMVTGQTVVVDGGLTL